MKIAIFEAEEWEKQYLREKLDPQDEIVFFDEPLKDDSEIDFHEIEAISIFVYSQLSSKVLKKIPNLKFISTRSTGFDHINLDFCKENKITVCNVPRYGDNTVAEHAFALLLAISRKIIPSVENVKKGDFCSDGLRGFDLAGKTIGIIGTGKIGSNIVRIASAFSMNVLGYDKKKNEELEQKYDLKYVSLEKLLAGSDVISLNINHTALTHHLINKETLEHVKPGAILINTARGGLIDTPDLLHALDEGILGGAGLDVLEEEGSVKEDMALISKRSPKRCLMVSVANNILIRHPKVIVTPHNAFNSAEAVERILDTTVQNILSFKNGKAANVVKG